MALHASVPLTISSKFHWFGMTMYPTLSPKTWITGFHRIVALYSNSFAFYSAKGERVLTLM